jgi:hypothetical protein
MNKIPIHALSATREICVCVRKPLRVLNILLSSFDVVCIVVRASLSESIFVFVSVHMCVVGVVCVALEVRRG